MQIWCGARAPHQICMCGRCRRAWNPQKVATRRSAGAGGEEQQQQEEEDGGGGGEAAAPVQGGEERWREKASRPGSSSRAMARRATSD
mmetsp:Transcript_42683/g.142044  ORF Transcript_42683/g.142044 Transcript_42683/m.142044 type:complete len:88 (-) Transcript_42683:108-371(-)